MVNESEEKLPEDLIIEILVRLPVKSLVRFKSVSKSWRDLIINPNFVNQHLVHDHKETLLVKRFVPSPPQMRKQYHDKGCCMLSLHDPDSSDLCSFSPNISIPFMCRRGDIVLFGPCNGLLFFWHRRDKAIMCNPALREFKVLPPCTLPFSHFCEHYDILRLGDGFGFDSTTGAYKIVRLYSISDWSDVLFYKVELYDSRSNRWRIIDYKLGIVPYGDAVFFKGACHWQAHLKDLTETHVVLCFDVTTEVFRHFEIPTWEEWKSQQLQVLRDRLTLIRHPNFPCISIEVWTVEGYGVKESWIKTFEIRTNFYYITPLDFLNDELLVEDDDFQLTSVDLCNGELLRTFTLCGLDYDKGAIVFKESLISLDDVIGDWQDDDVSLGGRACSLYD